MTRLALSLVAALGLTGCVVTPRNSSTLIGSLAAVSTVALVAESRSTEERQALVAQLDQLSLALDTLAANGATSIDISKIITAYIPTKLKRYDAYQKAIAAMLADYTVTYSDGATKDALIQISKGIKTATSFYQ